MERVPYAPATTIQVTKNVTINCYHEMSLQIVKTKQREVGCSFDAFTGGVQILSISCTFWENLTKLYVGAPWKVGAPTSGKSWIRHCFISHMVIVEMYMKCCLSCSNERCDFVVTS